MIAGVDSVNDVIRRLTAEQHRQVEDHIMAAAVRAFEIGTCAVIELVYRDGALQFEPAEDPTSFRSSLRTEVHRCLHAAGHEGDHLFPYQLADG